MSDAAPPVPVPSDEATRARIVTAARQWIGTPYHHQASHLQVGADCLGLVRGIYRTLHGAEPELPPPYSPDWAEARSEETLLAAARRHLIEILPATATGSDVLAFRWRQGLPAKHLAVLTAPDRFIHASEGHPVVEVRLTPRWRRRIAAAFAFPSAPPR
jgi:NlpC/P60 family putative phage cell wall peptidase